MKTYSRSTFDEARKAWAEGDFGDEWTDIRRIAAERGFIYPPAGTKWDDVEEVKSQRSIIYQAMADNPIALISTMRLSRSWHDVAQGVMAHRGMLRDQADIAEDDAEWEKRHHPSRKEAPKSIIAIMRKLWKRA